MSCAVDRQSLYLPSLNAQINSLKSGVEVRILPILLLYTGVVYMSLQPGIFEINSRILMDMMLWACCSLVLAFSIQEIEYEFDFDLFPGVVVNEVIASSGDNIGILSLNFLTSKRKSVVLMPIVFVNKGQTPIRTISFSLILCL